MRGYLAIVMARKEDSKSHLELSDAAEYMQQRNLTQQSLDGFLQRMSKRADTCKRLQESVLCD